MKYLKFTPSSFRDIGIMKLEICGKDSIHLYIFSLSERKRWGEGYKFFYVQN